MCKLKLLSIRSSSTSWCVKGIVIYTAGSLQHLSVILSNVPKGKNSICTSVCTGGKEENSYVGK